MIRAASEGGGEGVSQSLLKDKVFSTFLDQNPPLEPRPEHGIWSVAWPRDPDQKVEPHVSSATRIFDLVFLPNR